MSVLHQWADEYGIEEAAIDDLISRMGAAFTPKEPSSVESEAALQNKVRVMESRRGCRMFRNNRGVAFNKTGRPVRFGLGNDSSEVNKKSKSSDLIGVESIRITPEMVGDVIGRIVSLETKKPGWKYRGTSDEIAQLNWLTFVSAMGGRAAFVSSLEDYE